MPGAFCSTRIDCELKGALEKVLGIGGLFFRARNSQLLSQWYLTQLGVRPGPLVHDQTPWLQERGPTAFAPFDADTSYFGSAKNTWMVNFRVRDLDAMLAQLRAAGVDVALYALQYPNGRFARLYDPEGNPIEPWEPSP